MKAQQPSVAGASVRCRTVRRGTWAGRSRLDERSVQPPDFPAAASPRTLCW